MMNKTTKLTETSNYTIIWATEDDDTERRWTTTVTIDADQPITDVADIATDRFYSQHPDAQVVDEY